MHYIILYNIILYYIMGHWDSRQKLAVNVTDKLIALLLMLIFSTVFTCVSYNLKDNMISMKPLCNYVIVLDTIFED